MLFYEEEVYVKRVVDPIYSRLCPVCGGSAEASVLVSVKSCRKCSLTEDSESSSRTLHYILEAELSEFEEFFEKATGYKLWGGQRTWARRLLNHENVVITAPTGMGKTTLILVYSLYAVLHGRKVLILTPTKALAHQIHAKLIQYSNSIGVKPRIVYYDSEASKKKREEILSNICSNNYDILVVTNHFLTRRPDLVDPRYIDLIVVDDVDSLLKSNKNILRLIKLMGYSDEVVEKIKEKHRILWKLMVSRALDDRDSFMQYASRLIEIEKDIAFHLQNVPRKQVVIASATGRMRGVYAKILRDILMIDISGLTIYGRNITDSYKLFTGEPEPVVKLIEKMGPGCLILISPRHPFKDELEASAESIKAMLEARGFRVAYATPTTIEKFANKQLDVIIGSSSYYGVAVRGIDAPEAIRYVVFLGTPVFTIDVDTLLAVPTMLIRTALHLHEVLKNNSFRDIAMSVRKLIYTLNPNEQRLVSMMLRGKVKPDDIKSEKLTSVYNEIKRYYEEVKTIVRSYLANNHLISIGTITLLYRECDGRFLAVIPDVYTYIQASGRASRLYFGKMTHGLSVIFEYATLKNVVEALDLKMSFFTNTRVFRPLEEVLIEREVEEIERTRSVKEKLSTMKYRNILVVVESPTKAKTIAKFFGRPVRRKIGTLTVYEILFTREEEIIHLNIIATRGHIFDLTTDPEIGLYGVLIDRFSIRPVYETIKRCRVCGAQFTYGERCPKCGSVSFIDSFEVINALRKLASEADEIYIATDPDIEGEKIAYDIYLALQGFNDKIYRIELHEITLREFLKALENKRSVDKRLVNAEIYRRVLDRILGFSLSHKLWRVFNKHWLGAGRVQTPVLGWIINRYYEYKSSRYRFIVYEAREVPGLRIKVKIPLENRELYEKLLNVDEVVLKLKSREYVTVKPLPPYTTDQLLYDASKHGISVSTTMKIAQELFETGLITYHRTSSTYVSSTGIGVALKYLESKGLDKYANPSHWGSPGAHEAIRPVYPLDAQDLEKAVAEGLIASVIPLTPLHYKVYNMIFTRFIASQMKPYIVERSTYRVIFPELYEHEIVVDTDIVENGFNHVAKPLIFPALKNVDEIKVTVTPIAKYVASDKPLYSEGEIVNEMKLQGLGRPSTYAKIVEAILRHGYVVKSKRRGFLIPTKMGIAVYRYLEQNYPELISIDVTRNMERAIDLIASGEIDAVDAIEAAVALIAGYGLLEARAQPMASISS